MNRSKRIIVFVLVIVSIFMGALVLGQIKDASDRTKLNSYIDAAVNNYEKGETPYIDLTNINDFPWDRVYIFGSYSNCERIIQDINAPYFWLNCRLSGIEVYESMLLFVFKENDSIAGYATYFGHSNDRNNKDGYSRKEARFVLDEGGRMIWLEDK